MIHTWLVKGICRVFVAVTNNNLLVRRYPSFKLRIDSDKCAQMPHVLCKRASRLVHFLVQTCTMHTTLPDLPFTGYGDATTSTFHSSASASPRKYPRTDLKTLIPWTSFIDDVHQAVQSATALAELSSTPFTIGSPPRTRVVKRSYVHMRDSLYMSQLKMG